jgi:hypothetical protein
MLMISNADKLQIKSGLAIQITLAIRRLDLTQGEFSQVISTLGFVSFPQLSIRVMLARNIQEIKPWCVPYFYLRRVIYSIGKDNKVLSIEGQPWP